MQLSGSLINYLCNAKLQRIINNYRSSKNLGNDAAFDAFGS